MNDKLNNKISLYQILGIESNATQDEIRIGYKKMALKYHPDKANNKNNEIKISEEEKNKNFIEIKNAYDILSDKEKRRKYDLEQNINNMENLFDYKNYNLSMLYDDIKSLISNKDYLFFIKIIEKKFSSIVKSSDNINPNIINILINQNNTSIMSLLSNSSAVKILDINIQVEFSIYELYNNISKKIIYNRISDKIFEEEIFPIDSKQIYENEGEQININNILYKGNVIIDILINCSQYKKTEYHVVGTDLYVNIKSNSIIKNKIQIDYLNDEVYNFDLEKISYTKSDIGKIYCIKDCGLPYYDTTSILIDINKCEIKRGNLFFIIII